MVVANADTHAAGFIAALEAAGVTVGDATGKGLFPPFAIVYDISDSTSGSFANPAEDTAFVYQVTCVGRSALEARSVRDKAMLLLNGFSVNGHSIHVYKQDGSGRIERDDDTVTLPNGKKVNYYYYTPRFVVMSSPA